MTGRPWRDGEIVSYAGLRYYFRGTVSRLDDEGKPLPPLANLEPLHIPGTRTLVPMKDVATSAPARRSPWSSPASG